TTSATVLFRFPDSMIVAASVLSSRISEVRSVPKSRLPVRPGYLHTSSQAASPR
ncbi:hypothetical protein B0H12DRAFT_1122777, partial [Mycena haematopus]